MERYCSKCGKELTTEEGNVCYNCKDEQIYQDKRWEEFFGDLEKRNQNNAKEN